MLITDIKNIKSSKKELRIFGVIIGTLFAILGIILYSKQKDIHYYFFIAAAFFYLGLIIPKILLPLQKIWMSVFIILNRIITIIILAIVFYFLFLPIGLILRLLRKDLLNIKIKKYKTSFWNHRLDIKDHLKNYENQY
ncbi:MAG: SxtJ family membrane protein [Spirochaetia bacterium]|nr:SxtJ family membrane protein [Spirochaetia bacterium]